VNNIETILKHRFDDAVAGETRVSDLRGASVLQALTSISTCSRASARVNGAPRGEGDPPLQDTNETTVDVNLDALSLPRIADYSPVPLGFRLESGALDTRIRLRFVTRGAKAIGLTATGTAGLSKVSVRDASGAPLVSFERFETDIETIDVFARQAKVRSVRLERPFANVVRAKDGRLNLVEVLPKAATEARPGGGGGKPDVKSPRTRRHSILGRGHRRRQPGERGGSLGHAATLQDGARRDEVAAALQPPGRQAGAASFTTDGLGTFPTRARQLAPVRQRAACPRRIQRPRLSYLEPVSTSTSPDGTLDFDAGMRCRRIRGDGCAFRRSATLRAVVLPTGAKDIVLTPRPRTGHLRRYRRATVIVGGARERQRGNARRPTASSGSTASQP
jgi:hypothetical protein